MKKRVLRIYYTRNNTNISLRIEDLISTTKFFFFLCYQAIECQTPGARIVWPVTWYHPET